MSREESGIIVVEAAIWFPMLLLAYLAFIVVSLYITQRIVLDRAVAQACHEAVNWASDTMGKYDEVSAFSGTEKAIKVNPYWNLLPTANNIFYPMKKDEFLDKVKENVRKYAKWSLVGGKSGVDTLIVDAEFDFFWVYGELTVNASQTLTLPLNLTLLGMNPSWNNWEFRSTAKGRVFHTASLINDVNFIFDAVRILSGNKADINELRDRIGNFADESD